MVLWSGGADSTVILHDWATQIGSEEWPINAITFEHYLVNKEQEKHQKAARERYKIFAKERNLHIIYRNISVKSNIEPPVDSGIQQVLWACHMMPYFRNDDTIGFGYINDDDCNFWHYKKEFVDMINSYAKYRGITLDVRFPLEFKKKIDIVYSLKNYGIPPDCIWTCETPHKGKPCGICHKCEDLATACLKAKQPISTDKKKPIRNFSKTLHW